MRSRVPLLLALAACAPAPPDAGEPVGPGTFTEPPGSCTALDLADPPTVTGLLAALIDAAALIDPARGRFGLSEGDAACPTRVEAPPGEHWDGDCTTGGGLRFAGALHTWPDPAGGPGTWQADRWRLDDGVAPRAIDGALGPARLDPGPDGHLRFDGWIVLGGHAATAPEGVDGRLELRAPSSAEGVTTEITWDGRVVCRSGLIAQVALTGPTVATSLFEAHAAEGVLRAEGQTAALTLDGDCWSWTLDGEALGPLCP